MKLFSFIKKEPVLFAALLLAVISIICLQPSLETVASAIDWRVLSLLFCLMAVIQAFRSVNVLDALASSMLRLCKTKRSLYFSLVFIVFLSSMAVTNDVALLTFVPISLIICRKIDATVKDKVTLVILETLAANLGSCITPMGNPQNLFLFSYYIMETNSFFKTTLKLGIPSAVFLSAAIVFVTRHNTKLRFSLDHVAIKNPPKVTAYIVLLAVILCSVFRVVDYRISLCITIGVIALLNYRLFAKVDYTLLLTFSGFFIFTGTISKVPAVSAFLSAMLKTPATCYLTGILTSQVISNVPAALLLSGFTELSTSLLLAVNVGGLGTIIASLASVISYKLYNADTAIEAAAQNSSHISYMKHFTLWNLLFLAVLGTVCFFLMPL